MLNLTPHNRFHVPNRLAMLAAVLLLISSGSGFDPGSDINSSGVETVPAVKVVNSDNDDVYDDDVGKRRALNLGFLLFRR